MTRTVLGRRVRLARCLALTIVVLLVGSWSTFAQGTAVGDALLAWCGAAATCKGPTQSVRDLRIYGGIVTARIENRDDNDGNLGPDDRVPFFELRQSGNPTRALCFPNPNCGRASATDDTKSAAFNEWVKTNAKDLLNILFPSSLSEGVSGRDAAQNHSQQFLLNTAMAFTSGEQNARLRQSEAGALFEFEQYDGDGRPGIGLQGIYRMEGIHMSVLGRYSQQTQNGGDGPFGATTTRAVTITTDYHPSIVVYPPLDLRVGIDARTGLMLSRAAELNLGSLDFGGGTWMSARKDFARMRIGFGSLVQGSKSYLPVVADNLAFLAEAVNATPVAFDVSYGVLGGYALTKRASLNVKLLQTIPTESAGQSRANSTIVMGSVSYLVGGLTPVDVGYKVYTAGPISAHSVFLQGYYGW